MTLKSCVLTATLAMAGTLALPAVAQYQQPDRPQSQQDDRNRDRNQADRDRNQGDRSDAYNRGDRDNQWVNTKAYKRGLKDGKGDHDKNRPERTDRHHWKNDQDRQAYEAGYYSAYRGEQPRRESRDRNDHEQH